MRLRNGVVFCLPFLLAVSAQAGAALVALTTANGTVPGTNISYAISNSGGTPRAVFPAGSSDHNVWNWTGFPEFMGPGTPVSVAVAFSAPIPANRLVVPATADSETGTPAPNAVISKPERRFASNSDAKLHIPMTIQISRARNQNLTSNGGHFLLNYNINETTDAQAQTIAATFESAYQALPNYGFSWTGRTAPFHVDVYQFPAPYEDWWGDEVCSVFGDNSAYIEINSGRLTASGLPTGMKATIGHELFHALQELYDPRPRGLKCVAGTWYWYLDALSTWFESVFLNDNSYCPDTVQNENWYDFVTNGLEVGPASRAVQQENGYGASMFLRSLAAQDKTNTALAKVLEMERYQGVNLSGPSYDVAGAMNIVIRDNKIGGYGGISDAWDAFGKGYMAGTLYSKPFPAPSNMMIVNSGIYRFASANDTGQSWAWNMPDLSARIVRIDLTAAFPGNTTLVFTLTDNTGAGANALLYHLANPLLSRCRTPRSIQGAACSFSSTIPMLGRRITATPVRLRSR